MPLSPPRACVCGGKRYGSEPCTRCGRGKRESDKNRPNFRQRGYSWEWSKYSLRFRQENPLCAECLKQDRVTAATCVDHIVPHKGDMELFWNPGNHQSLCEKCHNTKSAKEK